MPSIPRVSPCIAKLNMLLEESVTDLSGTVSLWLVSLPCGFVRSPVIFSESMRTSPSYRHCMVQVPRASAFGSVMTGYFIPSIQTDSTREFLSK